MISQRPLMLVECILTALGPVVSGTVLSVDKVVRAEHLANRASTDGIASSRFQVDEDRTWHVLACASLVVEDADPLELLVVGTGVDTIRLDTVLLGDGLPELGTCGRERG
jgi:hypothetical protein